MDAVSSISAVVGLVFSFATAAKTCNDVRSRFKDVPRTIESTTHEVETLQGSLRALEHLMMNDPSVLASRWDSNDTLPRTFSQAIRGFEWAIRNLQKDLDSLQREGRRLGRRATARFLWNEADMKEHLGQLRSQSSALNFLLQVFQTDAISEVRSNIIKLQEALFFSTAPPSNNNPPSENNLPSHPETWGRTSYETRPRSPQYPQHFQFPPMILVVQQDNIAKATELLDASEYIEAVEPLSGRTAAAIAALHGKLAMLTLLLERGAQVSASDRYLRTPLHYAASEGHFHCVEILLAYGADARVRDFCSESPFIRAVKYGWQNIIGLFLSRNPDLYMDTDMYGRTALHYAAHAHDTALLALLIRYTQDMGHSNNCFVARGRPCTCPSRVPQLETMDHLGDTPLQIAMQLRRLSTVELLLSIYPLSVNLPQIASSWKHLWVEWNTKDVRTRGPISIPWERPLHDAVWRQDPELLGIFLAAGANAELPDSEQRTPLYYAIQCGNEEATKALLKHGTKFSKRYSEENQMTILHAAVNMFSPRILDSAARADLLNSPTSPDGAVLLHEALEAGRTDIVNSLMGIS